MHVIENFLDNPLEFRKVALSTPAHLWKKAPNKAWPGYRIPLPNTLYDSYFRSIKKYRSLLRGVDTAQIVMCLQWIDERYLAGCFHFDPDTYTMITYLNPNPPANSGTEVANDAKWDPGARGKNPKTSWGAAMDNFTRIKELYHSSDMNPIQGFFYKKKLDLYNSRFKEPLIVPNRFNRTLIFDGPRVHRAQNFFGNKVENSRLTLISFIRNLNEKSEEEGGLTLRCQDYSLNEEWSDMGDQ